MNVSPTAALASRLLRDYDATESVALRLGGLTFEVRSNAPELAARVREYYARFADPESPSGDDHPATSAGRPAHPGDASGRERSASVTEPIVIDAFETGPLPADALDGLDFRDWKREPGKTRRKEACADLPQARVVQKVRTGMLFMIGEGRRIAIGPCLRNANQIVNFINTQYMNHALHQGDVLCHAAGVVASDGALCIAATSGAGKSTLALHLMHQGWGFLSNDRVLVRENERPNGWILRGVPKLPRVNPGTLLNNPSLEGLLPAGRKRELASLEREHLWELEEKYDVPFEQVFPRAHWIAEAPLRSFVVLTWDPNSGARTESWRGRLRERPELVEPIRKSAGPFYLDRDSTPPRDPYVLSSAEYLERVGDARVLHLSGGVDFGAGVRACCELVV